MMMVIGIEAIGSVLKRKQVEIVWSCGEKRKWGLGEEMHVYGGGVCKAKREAKKDLIGSGWDMKGLGLANVELWILMLGGGRLWGCVQVVRTIIAFIGAMITLLSLWKKSYPRWQIIPPSLQEIKTT